MKKQSTIKENNVVMVRINKHSHRTIKTEAAKLDLTLTDFLDELVKQYLKGNKNG